MKRLLVGLLILGLLASGVGVSSAEVVYNCIEAKLLDAGLVKSDAVTENGIWVSGDLKSDEGWALLRSFVADKGVVGLVFTSSDVTDPAVTKIPDGALKGLVTLVGVSFDRPLVSIGASAFEGCTDLTTVSGDAPGSAIRNSPNKDMFAADATIGNNAFKNAKKLISIGGNKAYTVQGAAAVSAVDLKNVVSIGDNAFEGTAITNLVIENLPGTFGGGILKNTPNLAGVSFDNFAAIPDGMFEGSTVYFVSADYSAGKTKLTKIGDNAFKNATNVKVLLNLFGNTVPLFDNLTTIGAGAFATDLKGDAAKWPNFIVGQKIAKTQNESAGAGVRSTVYGIGEKAFDGLTIANLSFEIPKNANRVLTAKAFRAVVEGRFHTKAFAGVEVENNVSTRREGANADELSIWDILQGVPNLGDATDPEVVDAVLMLGWIGFDAFAIKELTGIPSGVAQQILDANPPEDPDEPTEPIPATDIVGGPFEYTLGDDGFTLRVTTVPSNARGYASPVWTLVEDPDKTGAVVTEGGLFSATSVGTAKVKAVLTNASGTTPPTVEKEFDVKVVKEPSKGGSSGCNVGLGAFALAAAALALIKRK